MPYLEYLFCEHCGNYARLDIDPTATIEAYRKDGRKGVAIVQPLLIWDYLVYVCGICQSRYRYTYQDVERRVREYFSLLSEEFKEYFDEMIRRAESGEQSPTQDKPIPLVSKLDKTRERVRNLYTAKT